MSKVFKICDKFVSHVSDCSVIAPVVGSVSPNVKCYRCGMLGHYAYACPYKKWRMFAKLLPEDLRGPWEKIVKRGRITHEFLSKFPEDLILLNKLKKYNNSINFIKSNSIEKEIEAKINKMDKKFDEEVFNITKEEKENKIREKLINQKLEKESYLRIKDEVEQIDENKIDEIAQGEEEEQQDEDLDEEEILEQKRSNMRQEIHKEIRKIRELKENKKNYNQKKEDQRIAEAKIKKKKLSFMNDDILREIRLSKINIQNKMNEILKLNQGFFNGSKIDKLNEEIAKIKKTIEIKNKKYEENLKEFNKVEKIINEFEEKGQNEIEKEDVLLSEEQQRLLTMNNEEIEEEIDRRLNNQALEKAHANILKKTGYTADQMRKLASVNEYKKRPRKMVIEKNINVHTLNNKNNTWGEYNREDRCEQPDNW